MKHKAIEGSDTSLKNEYATKNFSNIFRMLISHLNMRRKKIILFIMIMLFLPLQLLSDNNDTFKKDEIIYETLYFNKYIDTKVDRKPFFVFEILKKNKNIVNSSFDEIDGKIATHTKHGNLYNLKYPNGYSSTIELVKKRIEFIEYFSINVEIYKNNELQYKFSSDSDEYYDYRYPNCISRHGDSGFNEGIIEIKFHKKMTNRILNFLKINQWLPFVYTSDDDDYCIKNANDCRTNIYGTLLKTVNEVFIKKELCDNDKCEVQVIVKGGKEFNAISKINGLNNGICATRVASEAGGSIMPIIVPTDEIYTLDRKNPLSDIKDKDSLEKTSEYYDNLPPTAAGGGKSSVDYAIEKLKNANIVFDTPSSMYRNKTYIINLKLDAVKDISDLLKELNSSEKESAVVKYSSTMKAELISENKKAFDITPITPDTQVISSINTTSWKWDVTPLEQGEQNLHLSLTAFLDIEGKEKALSIKTFDKVIKVNISYPDEITLFIQNNWKWILGSLLFPLIGLWWKNTRKKEE